MQHRQELLRRTAPRLGLVHDRRVLHIAQSDLQLLQRVMQVSCCHCAHRQQPVQTKRSRGARTAPKQRFKPNDN